MTSISLTSAFSQVDRTKPEEFIEQFHQNLEPMITTGQSIYDSLIEEGMENRPD